MTQKLKNLDWTLNPREGGRIEFICRHGIGHYPHWMKDSVHGCDGCCRHDDFPGRVPKVGDIALCGHATLGLVTTTGLQAVTYKDGNQAEAYIGIHMTDVTCEKGSEWSSRNPIVIGTIYEMYDLNSCLRTYVIERLINHIGGVEWIQRDGRPQ